MRIISVRLDYIYDNSTVDEEDPTKQSNIEARRDRLSNLGFDVSKMDNGQLQSYPVLGMTDSQFIELTIAGEKNMEIIAWNVLD
jgi:hypothetical protein